MEIANPKTTIYTHTKEKGNQTHTKDGHQNTREENKRVKGIKDLEKQTQIYFLFYYFFQIYFLNSKGNRYIGIY